MNLRSTLGLYAASQPGISLKVGESVTVDGLPGRGVITHINGTRVTVRFWSTETVTRDQGYVHSFSENTVNKMWRDDHQHTLAAVREWTELDEGGPVDRKPASGTIKQEGTQFCITTDSGESLGCYPSQEAAENRLNNKPEITAGGPGSGRHKVSDVLTDRGYRRTSGESPGGQVYKHPDTGRRVAIDDRYESWNADDHEGTGSKDLENHLSLINAGGPGSGVYDHKKGAQESKLLKLLQDAAKVFGPNNLWSKLAEYGHVGDTTTPYTPEEKATLKAMKTSVGNCKIGYCFMNAQRLTAYDKNPAVKYVEGLVTVHGVPIDHAWVEINGKVYDPTINKTQLVTKKGIPMGEYVGVNVPKDAIVANQLAKETYSPLTHNWGDKELAAKIWKK